MKQSVFIGILAATDIALSFAMQLVIVTTIGLGRQMDALYACMVMPALILGILHSSLMHVLVPLLTVTGKEEFERDRWSLFLLVGGVLAVLAVALSVEAPIWVRVIVPGFDEAGRLLVQLTRIQLLATAVTSELAVLSAIYHARNTFVWPEVVPLIGDGVGLAILPWALARYGIFSVVWLNVVSVAIQMVMLTPTLGRFRRPDLRSANLKLAWLRLRPLLAGSAYYKTDAVLDRALSSLSKSGGFSLLYIGQQVYGATNQIVCKSVCAPIVPKLTERADAHDWMGFRQLLRRGLVRVGSLMLGSYLVLLLVGERLLRLIIGHGHVTSSNVHLLWILMVLSAGALIGGPVGQILSTTLYATGDTRSPTRVGARAYTIGIVLKFVMFFFFGLKGLAIAISIYYALSLVMLMQAIGQSIPRASALPDAV